MPSADSIRVNGPDLSRSRSSLDFGAGFYVTTRHHRALEWALVASGDRAEAPAVMCWEVRYDDFASCPKLAFAEAGPSAEDFWVFVRLNRRIRQPHRAPPLGHFDIVVGPASRNHKLKIPVPDMDQISFHTEAGLALLGISRPVTYGVRGRVTVPVPSPARLWSGSDG